MVRILFFYASYTVSLCDFVDRAPNAVVANPTSCSSKSLQPFSAQHDWSSQVARSNLLRAVSQLVEPSNSCCTAKHSANDQLGCLTLGLLNAAVFVRPFQICQICNTVANAYGGFGQKISFFPKLSIGGIWTEAILSVRPLLRQGMCTGCLPKGLF